MDYSGFLTGNFQWKSLRCIFATTDKSKNPHVFPAVEENTLQTEESIDPLLSAPAPAHTWHSLSLLLGLLHDVCWKPAQGSNKGKALASSWEVPAQPLWWLTWHCHTGQAEGLWSEKLFPAESLLPGSGLAAGASHCCHLTACGMMAAAKPCGSTECGDAEQRSTPKPPALLCPVSPAARLRRHSFRNPEKVSIKI